jgi:hypothetical protein
MKEKNALQILDCANYLHSLPEIMIFFAGAKKAIMVCQKDKCANQPEVKNFLD